MINIKENILKKALLESTLKEIRAIESIDYPEIKTEKEYDEKILKSIRINKQFKAQRHYPKRIAIIVAAIIVCFTILISISAVRIKVIDFFVEVYETFASFFIDKDENIDIEPPSKIETQYEPTYMNENNFKLINQIKNESKVISIWKKDNITIYLTQYIIDENNIKLDIEDTDYYIEYIDNQKIYYIFKNNTYDIRWLTNEYSFNLICSGSLGWQEIENIIKSLYPVETN